MSVAEARKLISCPYNIKKYLSGKIWRNYRLKFESQHNRKVESTDVQELYNIWLQSNNAKQYIRLEKRLLEERQFKKSQISGKYSFDLIYNPKYHTHYNSTSYVYVSGICIVAKNTKYGGMYFSKYITNRNGKFSYYAGSHKYPVLCSNNQVIISVKDFPKLPMLSDISNTPMEYECWSIVKK